MKKRIFSALLMATLVFAGTGCGKTEEGEVTVEIEIPPQPDMEYEEYILNSSAWIDNCPVDKVIRNLNEFKAFNEMCYGVCNDQGFISKFPVNEAFFEDHYIIARIERAENNSVSYEIAGIDFDAGKSPFIIARPVTPEGFDSGNMNTWFLFRVVKEEKAPEPLVVAEDPTPTPEPTPEPEVVTPEYVPEWIGTLVVPEKFVSYLPEEEPEEGEEIEPVAYTYGTAPLSSVYLLYAYYFEVRGNYDRFIKDTRDYTAQQLIDKLDETIIKNTDIENVADITDEDRDDFTNKILSLSGFAKTKDNVKGFFTGDWTPDGTDYWNGYEVTDNGVYVTFGIYYEDLRQRQTAVPIDFKGRDYKLFTRIDKFELPKDEDGNEIEEIKDRKSTVVYTFYTANELSNHLTTEDFEVSYVGKLENFEITGIECTPGKIKDTAILTVNYLIKESTGKELLQEKDFRITALISEDEDRQWP